MVKWATAFNDMMAKLNLEMNRSQSLPLAEIGSYCAAKSQLDGKILCFRNVLHTLTVSLPGLGWLNVLLP